MKTYDECKNEVARSEGRYNWTEFMDELESGIGGMTVDEAYSRVADLYARQAVLKDRKMIYEEIYSSLRDCGYKDDGFQDLDIELP